MFLLLRHHRKNWKLNLNGIYDCCLQNVCIAPISPELQTCLHSDKTSNLWSIYVSVHNESYDFYYFCPEAPTPRENKLNYVDALYRVVKILTKMHILFWAVAKNVYFCFVFRSQLWLNLPGTYAYYNCSRIFWN